MGTGYAVDVAQHYIPIVCCSNVLGVFGNTNESPTAVFSQKARGSTYCVSTTMFSPPEAGPSLNPKSTKPETP